MTDSQRPTGQFHATLGWVGEGGEHALLGAGLSNHCADCRVSRFWRVAFAAAGIAKILFFIFLVIFVIALVTGFAGRGVLRFDLAGGFRGRSLGGEHARQLAQRLLVTLVRDLGKVPGELQAHSFARADRAIAVLFETIEKIADRHAEHVGDLK